MANYYQRICSCCGEYIESKQMKFLKETGQLDVEGNHCSQCYYDIDRDNYRKMQKLFEQIEDALSTPLKKFTWRMKPIEERTEFVMSCIEKGYITFSIGGRV